LRVAVNISPRQFRYPQLADRIRRILVETEMEPGLLELEITESMIMHDVDAAIRTMNELTALGIQLAIDDFGSGYSSLHYLGRFPIRRLKIDRDFVRDITTSAGDAAIASAVIALARTMTLEVVAEGIETREQLAFLKEKECQIGQGYLFSRPLPADDLSGILRAGKVPLD
jgi:EAL domain-containing protein (putative c-di-GMP-specific phosphodiesterase class I)